MYIMYTDKYRDNILSYDVIMVCLNFVICIYIDLFSFYKHLY